MTRTSRKNKRRRTVFEWLILSVALAATALIVGSLTFLGLTSDGGPPRFELHVEEIPSTEPARTFEVEVVNVGDSTAEEVMVAVVAGDEETETLIKAVAKGDSEKFTVVFPASLQEQPVASIKSYKKA